MEGGCLCRAVRYAIDGAVLNSGICHCETCRRTASAPGLPFIGVRMADFRFTRGQAVDYASSADVIRSFCGQCGSPLTYRHSGTVDKLDVMTVSLDDPNAVPPTFNVWVSEAVDWDSQPVDRPSYPQGRATTG
jgi:hypothetical protein